MVLVPSWSVWSVQMAQKSNDKVKHVYRERERLGGGWCWDDSTLLGERTNVTLETWRFAALSKRLIPLNEQHHSMTSMNVVQMNLSEVEAQSFYMSTFEDVLSSLLTDTSQTTARLKNVSKPGRVRGFFSFFFSFTAAHSNNYTNTDQRSIATGPICVSMNGQLMWMTF